MAKSISIQKRKVVYKKYKGKCAYCGVKLDYSEMQVDHIIPKHRGSTNSELSRYGISKGTNDIYNLNPSCGSCNSSKSTFTLDNWKKELELKHQRLLNQNSSYRILNRFGVVRIKKEIRFHFEK